jgi:hypothetical protein
LIGKNNDLDYTLLTIWILLEEAGYLPEYSLVCRGRDVARVYIVDTVERSISANECICTASYGFYYLAPSIHLDINDDIF